MYLALIQPQTYPQLHKSFLNILKYIWYLINFIFSKQSLWGFLSGSDLYRWNLGLVYSCLLRIFHYYPGPVLYLYLKLTLLISGLHVFLLLRLVFILEHGKGAIGDFLCVWTTCARV